MRHDILVIDDDEKITSVLRRSLAFEGYKVTTSNYAEEGLNHGLVHHPDLIILDIMMPVMDGLEVCRRIREAGNDTPILMLTAKDGIEDRVSGLDLGADDYLVKPFALEELLARVRALLRRKTENKEDLNRRLSFDDIVLDLDSREVLREGRAIELTTKEFDLLHLFLLNPKRVLTRDTIMEKIWGFDFIGESNVLEVYIALLRQKLEDQGGKRVIQTIRGTGYVLRSDS